ncbi:hypothetical protein Ais01nite_04740 [Asanoa ishikariensis]|uniref:hypothetical protein n=1 Tax=Asanoa ishikariensis TaxID=137265 RepID=UPI0019503808|nr:hypothetical protein [Asanoa ishikariensis]GIF62439.1 hypothetical protein Ais01nite_04740 [Asanoa ishikariensis]
MIEDPAGAPLSQALADFARLHPAATLEVFTAAGPAMREAFSAGRLHLALWTRPTSPTRHGGRSGCR